MHKFLTLHANWEIDAHLFFLIFDIFLKHIRTRNSPGDEIAKRDLMIYDKTYRRCHFSVYLFILQQL